MQKSEAPLTFPLQWYWYQWANHARTRITRTNSSAYYARMRTPARTPASYNYFQDEVTPITVHRN